MPPTDLWPFSCSSPRAFAPARKSSLRVSSARKKRHVHPRTRRRLDLVQIEAARIDRVVEQLRLLDVAGLDRLEPALPLQPLEHEARDVDRVGGRRVVQRVVRGDSLPFECGRADRQCAIEKILADDHDRHAGHPDVLLRAAEQHAVFRDVHRARQDVRRHVGDERHVAEIGNLERLDAVDRLVRAQMHVGGIVRQLPLGVRRRTREAVGRLAGRGQMRRAVLLRFVERLLRPRAGHDEVGGLACAEQVHRHDCILRNAAALQEQDPMARRHVEQLTQVGQRGLVDRHELLAAMAHLHHAHAAAVPVEHFVGSLPQHFFGQRRGAGGEIKDAHRENLGGTRPAACRHMSIAISRAKKEMAACARAQTAIIALSPGSRQTRPDGRARARRRLTCPA